MKNLNEVTITDICVSSDSVKFSYDGPHQPEAWLENKNKHEPDILYLDVDTTHQRITIGKDTLNQFMNRSPGHTFRLSLCTVSRRIRYKVQCGIQDKCFNKILIFIECDEVFFRESISAPESTLLQERVLEIQHENPSIFKEITKLPVGILDIGSCFSRSIFKSDAYFNPTYKKYFLVKKTLFHNSFISLFSKAIDYDYTQVEDLMTGDAALYAGIEFRKDVEQLLKEESFQLVVVDNYMDASTPVIRFVDDSYLTYNKYLSESVFKRFFSSCEIIYPGSEQHRELYRNSIVAFRRMLQAYNIKNVVLIGGRLSKWKIDEGSCQTDMWDNKMEWIINTNGNWDEVDRLFLEEIPEAIYIDKRNTSWKSDVHSPIIGGASPSHYQSGYYKELFEELLQLFSEEMRHE